ncbi:MAG: hypothetical protein E6K53_10695 [Gammaproteobacteria bacterium]|nr:MAG: hypothetical protein E6K53_10695 [Gammaproteobacteria bacterium]
MRSFVHQRLKNKRRPRGRWRPLALALLSLVTLAALGSSNALADDVDDRRVRAGARLFRSLLAAETALEAQAGADGALHVVVLGGENATASDVSLLIAASGESGKSGIRDLPVKIERIANVAALDGSPKPAGIFLAGIPSDADLAKLIAWSNAAHIVLYSPFEGHVERGVAAGIAVEAKVQPYLNLPALQAAGVEIKPFYLKVAKVYP